MLYRHLIDYCMQAEIGVHGLSEEEVVGLTKSLALGFDKLKNREFLGAVPLLDLPSRGDDFEEIEALAEAIRKRFAHVVVVGSGGSGLSGSALLEFSPCRSPSFSFLDNIDPDMMEDILARAPLEHTCFIVISKSGTTVETLSQLYALIERVKNVVGRSYISTGFIMITEPEVQEGANPMRSLALEYDIRVLDHAPDIGGRFSILTNVGLLPAAIAGIDIRGLRRGAGSVVAELEAAQSPADFAPALGAAVQYGFAQRSRNMSIMLPYSQRLSGFSAWYRQCWAESLGKDGKGTTPVRSVGSTDQHSQLQLYLSGPKDKIFTLITLKREGTGDFILLPEGLLEQYPELSYLKNKTIGDIMAAQQRATFETLIKNRCPTRLMEIDALNVETLGALLMHFTLEIIFMSFLLEVNPFDQPAVEESKVLAREYLAADGGSSNEA